MSSATLRQRTVPSNSKSPGNPTSNDTATLPVEKMGICKALASEWTISAHVSCENCPKRSHQRATMWLGVGKSRKRQKKSLSNQFRKADKPCNQAPTSSSNCKYHIPKMLTTWNFTGFSCKLVHHLCMALYWGYIPSNKVKYGFHQRGKPASNLAKIQNIWSVKPSSHVKS